MNKKIYLSTPHMCGKELHNVRDVFASNWIAPLGAYVDGFERDLQSYIGVEHVAVLNSGTSSIHLALILLGVEPGDVVICQSFTFSASANPISYLGARPIFIDSEKDTWNMDPQLLEKAILDCIKGDVYGIPARKPKAIIPVHLYGMPAKMDELCTIAKQFDIPIIEDAAEALGSKYRGKPCGSYGELGILSFNGNKIITTSGGGALLSDNEAYIEKARFLATQARDDAPHYQHSEIGYNYRMSNVLAAIGRGQMSVLPHRVNQKRKINRFYHEILDNVDGIDFLSEPDERFYSNFWLTTILVDEHKTGFSREALRLALKQENIESRPLWKPMHLQPVFKHAAVYENGTSAALFRRGLCLPSGTNMTDEDLKRIKAVLMKMIDKSPGR